jgi:uncharacterized protein YdeI (YjbR/CyaY-like superfamily)
MPTTNPKVDAYFQRGTKWHDELQHLRRISLDCGLTEELKWRSPCYTFGDRNVVIAQEFKEYCALMFFKGALLRDPKGILVPPGTSQAARQIRFTGVDGILELEPDVRAYIQEAIGVEQVGSTVALKKTSEYEIPEEFQRRLDAVPALREAFDALTPGRQRAYLLHFAAPKQAKTRESRIERCVPRILEGKGLTD